ncbi:hypothetical protein AYO20_00755 [Fonsecaea nubica]|uniref:Major facilitator superfamily (MFS) profile domain-containing protein n=1 Tax=Fonsecaea nubica TaxID=856822 RepID=A0A178DF57_9EURO|nr:hypothetical protein AYO20_00755 [Fonsecaea nubica]OAL39843.1 hypothetical protein AYO20_00755 [Fonsecaea nubica]
MASHTSQPQTTLDETKMASEIEMTKPSLEEGQHRDVNEQVSFTPDPRFERKLIRKLDLLTVPVMILIYFLSFLDRTNIGNARLQGLQEELGLTDRTYRIALTVLYVPYILLEIPSNLVLKKIGPHIFLPTLMTIWGIVATLQVRRSFQDLMVQMLIVNQGIVKSTAGLYVNRFFLGAVEAGIVPAIILYLSMWYKRGELQTRIGLFWGAASLSGAIGGLLAAAISNLDGHASLRGWSWIFIIEVTKGLTLKLPFRFHVGIFTVVCGFASFFLIAKAPETTRFLSEQEREYAVARLRHDAMHANQVTIDGVTHHLVVDNSFSWKAVYSVFVDPQMYGLAVVAFSSGTLVFSQAYFLPTVISDMKSIATTPVIAQLLTVPPYTVGVITTLIGCHYSDKYHFRYPSLAIPTLVAIIGVAIIYATEGVGVRYFGIHLTVAGIYSSVPVYLSWGSNNFSGHYRRATGVAAIFVFTNSGGILSTWLFRASEAPSFQTAYIINLALLCVLLVSGTGLSLYYLRQNKIRDGFVRSGRFEEYGMDKDGDQHLFFRYVR